MPSPYGSFIHYSLPVPWRFLGVFEYFFFGGEDEQFAA
jgi:hypothetical protein